MCLVAALLSWHPHATVASALGAVVATVVATVAFGSIGLALAGRLRAEANLAAANGLYLVLLLTSGMVVPLARLPRAVADVARLLPPRRSPPRSAAHSRTRPCRAPQWAVLLGWAVGAAGTFGSR